MLAEAVLGVVVLGVTATLVNAAPARVSYATPVDVTVAGRPRAGRVQVHVDPAKQGAERRRHLPRPARRPALHPAGDRARGCAASGRTSGRCPSSSTAAEPGHYVATALTVPSPGDWTLRLTVRTSDIDEQTIDVPVRIR